MKRLAEHGITPAAAAIASAAARRRVTARVRRLRRRFGAPASTSAVMSASDNPAEAVTGSGWTRRRARKPARLTPCCVRSGQVGVNHPHAPRIGGTPRQGSSRCVAGFGPALQRHQASTCVDTDGTRPGKRRHASRTTVGRSAPDVPKITRSAPVEQRRRPRHAAHAAANLDRNDSARQGGEGRLVHGIRSPRHQGRRHGGRPPLR